MMDLIVSYPSLARNKFENKNPLCLLMEDEHSEPNLLPL